MVSRIQLFGLSSKVMADSVASLFKDFEILKCTLSKIIFNTFCIWKNMFNIIKAFKILF